MKSYQSVILGALSCALTRVLATTSSTAAIDLSMSTDTFNKGYLNSYSKTFLYEENTNYDPCLCDLTARSCDAYCCCDNDC